MSLRDDFRRLAADDPHVRVLANATDGWFERRGITVLASTTGDSAVCVRAESCPTDASATARIMYWAADHSRDLAVELARSSLLALDEAERIGSPSIWGVVPLNAAAQHLREFLDAVVAARACRRDVSDEYPDHVFYVAAIDAARRYMERIVEAPVG